MKATNSLLRYGTGYQPVRPAHRQPVRHGRGSPVWQPCSADTPPGQRCGCARASAWSTQRFLPTKLAMADVAFDVLLETGINISPLPVWLDEWEHPETYSNPLLLKNIANDGIRL